MTTTCMGGGGEDYYEKKKVELFSVFPVYKGRTIIPIVKVYQVWVDDVRVYAKNRVPYVLGDVLGLYNV